MVLNFDLDVFLLITGGVIIGILILFLEIIFKRRKERKEVDYEISRSAISHWRKRIEVNENEIIFDRSCLNKELIDLFSFRDVNKSI